MLYQAYCVFACPPAITILSEFACRLAGWTYPALATGIAGIIKYYRALIAENPMKTVDLEQETNPWKRRLRASTSPPTNLIWMKASGRCSAVQP